ncbi:ABC transporter ATP-binding protein [Andreprevotia chitinilytica]|uniref:ABC transporter ATP-binding protein n=1 Tax=Andreprevotia chitinilytica TaxID=396808 RepID=UPI00068CCCE3|nr:ABC transporter ATP-binding protein [Andreprevotia chitinilytica]
MLKSSLACTGLRLGYAERPVIDGLDLAIPDGSITALLGPNGCGKSTLLRGLAGLLPPSAGSVSLDDEPLHRWPKKRLARRLAFLPQQQQYPEGLTVAELVAHGRFPHRPPWGGLGSADREAISWALAATGLTNYAKRGLDALSGGERQRVWIAMALAQQADILLLDEPTTYLDLGHQLEVMTLLRELNRSHGITLVMSLHDLNQAIRYTDHAVVMQAGRLIAQGNPAQIIEPGLLAAVYQVEASLLSGAADGLPVCHPERPLSLQPAPAAVTSPSISTSSPCAVPASVI